LKESSGIEDTCGIIPRQRLEILPLAALDQRNDQHHEEDDKQNPRDGHRNARYAKQAERTGEQRDEQKNQCVVEHKFKGGNLF